MQQRLVDVARLHQRAAQPDGAVGVVRRARDLGAQLLEPLHRIADGLQCEIDLRPVDRAGEQRAFDGGDELLVDRAAEQQAREVQPRLDLTGELAQHVGRLWRRLHVALHELQESRLGAPVVELARRPR